MSRLVGSEHFARGGGDVAAFPEKPSPQAEAVSDTKKPRERLIDVPTRFSSRAIYLWKTDLRNCPETLDKKYAHFFMRPNGEQHCKHCSNRSIGEEVSWLQNELQVRCSCT
jgi:hypothetical protein